MAGWMADSAEAVDSVFGPPELTPAQFRRIGRLVYEKCGINLQPGKEALVRSRLTKRLSALGVSNFDHYIDFVQREVSGDELRSMLDALTTNKTSFFRERPHFDFLRNHVLPEVRGHGWPLRFWCAGCSTGEEPYSLAIELHRDLTAEEFGNCRILATDISERVLAQARAAVYSADKVEDVPKQLLGRYFVATKAGERKAYEVRREVRAAVRFARLNLMESWPMSGPFDLIFCRNVMIYFDLATRKRLVRRFWELLRPGSHLFVGHSESLTQSSPEYRYVQPAIYQKHPG